jgi:stage V sporulation protein AF
MAKPFHFSGFNMMSYVLNGYFLTMNVVLIVEDLEKRVHLFMEAHPDGNFTLQELMDYLNTHVAFVQVQPVEKMEDAVRFILSGPLVTFIDGFDQALLIDTRIYPMRSIEEPEIERLVRGPRDGFTETMLMNTALVRRRLRDPALRAELMQVGTRSKTDVCMMYLNDVANPEIVDEVRSRLKNIDPDTVAMGEQAVAELIGKVKWNPYPNVRFTERPDVAATALVEGHVLVVVDTTPEVIIAPITFFQLMQHPEEYHSYPLVGTYMRWVIIFATLIALFMPGAFLMINFHPDSLPKELTFFKATRSDPLPLWAELLIAEVVLDVLRLAVMNIPVALAAMVSIMAAVIFSQFVTAIHLMQPEVLVYMALVLISQFALSSFELASANQIARLWILLITQMGKWLGLGGLGFGVGAAAWFIYLATRKSFGIPYMWPLLPFKWKNGMHDVLLRRPVLKITGRPAVLHPKIMRRKG